jgi:hypothetical protein
MLPCVQRSARNARRLLRFFIVSDCVRASLRRAKPAHLRLIHLFPLKFGTFGARRDDCVAGSVLCCVRSVPMIGLINRFGSKLPAITVFVAMLFVPASADAPGDSKTVTVALDQATVMKLPERVATLVVGNPIIADVTLNHGGVVIVTGKGYGMTNFMALDRSGSVLIERQIEVKAPAGPIVTVYKGVNRESYNCTPKCEPRNNLGDGQQHFEGTLNQITTRATISQGLQSGSDK